MPDPLSPRRVSWSRRLAQRWRGLLRCGLTDCGHRGLADQIRLSKRFIQEGWKAGAAVRTGLLLLLTLSVAIVWVIAGQGGGFPLGGPDPGVPTVILAGLAWSVACAAAASLPLWGFGVVAFWLAYHGLLLMAPWVGTAVMPLPVLWLVAVGLAVGARRGTPPGWGALAGWLALCAGAGWFLAGPLGLNGLFGGITLLRNWAGPLIMAVVLAPAWRLRPWLRRHRWTEPEFGRVLAGSVAVTGAGLAVSLLRSGPEATQGWAAQVVNDCGYLALLAWYWLAGGFAVCSLKIMESGTRLAVRGLTLRTVSRLFPLLWAAVTVTEWLGSHESAERLRIRIGPGRLDHWMASWPWEIQVAAWGHAWVGVAVLAAGAGFLWQGREGVRLLPRLHALWMASFFCILAVSPVLAAFITPAPAHAGQIWWWAPAVLLGGLLRDLAQAGQERIDHTAEGLPARVGWRVTMLAVLLALEWRNGTPWPVQGGLAALLGILHLALPRALHQWWTRGRGGAGTLPVSTQIWLSAAGMAAVLPMLYHNSQSMAVLAFAPVVWLPVLLWLRCHRPGLAASSGALAGALLGSGTVAAWCRPDLLLPEVPVLPFLNAPPAVLTAEAMAARPFLDPAHFTLLLLLTTTGAVLGAIVFRYQPPMGEIPIAIAEPAA